MVRCIGLVLMTQKTDEFRFVKILTSTINFMTRGFDDLTLTFSKTKLCDHDKNNW